MLVRKKYIQNVGRKEELPLGLKILFILGLKKKKNTDYFARTIQLAWPEPSLA